MTTYLPTVTDATVVGDHRLRVVFDDGFVRVADFTGYEWSGVLEPLRDTGTFAAATVDPEAGTVTWPGDLDLAPETLYAMAQLHPISPAQAG